MAVTKTVRSIFSTTMVMIMLIKKFIAVPIRMLAGIIGFVRIFDPLPLWQASWRLSRNPQDGCNVLVLLFNKRGIEPVREMAEKMIVLVKDSALAMTMGLLEIKCSHDYDAAKRWLKMAEDLQAERQELLLGLKLFVSKEADESYSVIERILARNDLPMEITRQALSRKSWKLLDNKQWAEAEQIADRILSIEEQIDARLVKWTALLARGERGADEQLKKAQGRVPDAVFSMLLAQGYLILGDVGNAMEWLYKAEKEKPWVRTLESDVGELARSEEFQSYCRKRESQ